MKKSTCIPSAILFLATAVSASAATISWTTANFDGDDDIVNSGVTVEAANFTGNTGNNALGGTTAIGSTVTINGVNFSAVNFSSGGSLSNLSGLTYNNGEFGHTTATTGFGAISAGLAFQSGVNPQNATLTGLIPGNDYTVQIFYYHRTVNRNVTVQDGTGSNITIVDPGNTGIGGFATGTFTADANTQTVNFAANTGSQFLNGYQLRDNTIPEPGSALLLGLGALAFLRRRAR